MAAASKPGTVAAAAVALRRSRCLPSPRRRRCQLRGPPPAAWPERSFSLLALPECDRWQDKMTNRSQVIASNSSSMLKVTSLSFAQRNSCLAAGQHCQLCCTFPNCQHAGNGACATCMPHHKLAFTFDVGSGAGSPACGSSPPCTASWHPSFTAALNATEVLPGSASCLPTAASAMP